MIRRLSVFLFLPFFCFAGQKVICSFLPDDDGGVFISCHAEDGVPVFPTDLPEMMSYDACESLKQEVTNILSSVISSLSDIDTQIMDSLEVVRTAEGEIYDIKMVATDYLPSSTNKDDIIRLANQSYTRLSNVEYDLSSEMGQIRLLQNSCSQQISRVESFVCVNQECSGTSSGSLSCPCTTEFNSVLSAVNAIRSESELIRKTCTSNSVALLRISALADIISSSVNSITNRLAAPDDRMWGELDEIYMDFATNSYLVSVSSLNLPQIFYSIRELIRGDSGSRLQLTTEGVLQLYNTVFGIASSIQSQLHLDSFHESVKYFSNTVTRLYKSFDFLGSNNAGYVPPDSRYPSIYSVFTNHNISSRSRYQNLSRIALGAGITNWFQRMELYQQALLGWFDDYSKIELEDQQDRYTESSMKDALVNTTNGLGVITQASSNVYNNAESVFSFIVDDLSDVQITASLPSLVTILPQYEIGDFGDFGPIVLETSGISEYCDFARSVSTLVWKVIIWSIYVVAAIGAGRIVFILVLYLIHLVHNL